MPHMCPCPGQDMVCPCPRPLPWACACACAFECMCVCARPDEVENEPLGHLHNCRIRAPTDFIYGPHSPNFPPLLLQSRSQPLSAKPSRPATASVSVRATYGLCSSFCTFRQFTFIAWRMRCLRAAQDVPPGSAMPLHEIYTHCGLGRRPSQFELPLVAGWPPCMRLVVPVVAMAASQFIMKLERGQVD